MLRKSAFLAALVSVVAACGTAGSNMAESDSSIPASSTTTSSTTTFVTTTMSPEARGLLPQTKALPLASGDVFDNNVNQLWSAIRSGNSQLGDQFFFPLTAYVQVKAISDPVHDYDTRLMKAYHTDLLSYHAQLNALGGTPELIGLEVPQSQAAWILPGEEYNKGSYWRVYGSELVFSEDGVRHYFPVYSLISWRGEWYVVHLGPPTQ